jgi:hypothetical protein
VVDAFLGLLDGAEAQDADDDFDAECGLLPGLIKLRRSGEHAENCLTV